MTVAVHHTKGKLYLPQRFVMWSCCYASSWSHDAGMSTLSQPGIFVSFLWFIAL